MNQKSLFALWGGLFVLCAGLGFIPEPAGFVKALLVLAALGFFVPPALLLYRAGKKADRACIALIRNLAAAWLLVTLVLLVSNFMSLLSTTALGDRLYTVLIIATSPMVCGQSWIMTMFCWACLFFTGNHLLKTTKP